MGDDFTIHLVSNVSPELFPTNNPAKFSTQLANEIDLSEGKWEVGVRDIMYPTTIATTTAEDKISIYKYKDYYRDLLPHPTRNNLNRNHVGAVIDFKNDKTANAAKDASSKADSKEIILKKINETWWSAKKNLLKMEYNEKFKKFILHVYQDDIVIAFSKALHTFLGFHRVAHTRGTYWALKEFKNEVTDFKDMEIFLFDLQTLETEEHELMKSVTVSSGVTSYSKIIPYKFYPTLPDECYEEPKFKLEIQPELGYIKIIPETKLGSKYKKHENRLAFFSFDPVATEMLGFSKIYAHTGKTYINIPQIKPTKINKQALEDIKSIKVTCYYSNVRDIGLELDLNSVKTFSTQARSEIKKPTDLLPSLNQKSREYNYKFSYDSSLKRFRLQTGKTYAIQISKNLASILGFDYSSAPIYEAKTIIQAPEFPILNRDITALYVYTNIINPVYIGDVQAPLLLSCPFKTDNAKNIVNQISFLNPNYTLLNRSKIHQIDIGIYDEAGSLIPFLYGKTNITLHFRKH